jgi:hypothetical protein
MIALKQLTNFSILSKETRLKPEIRNVNRWSSTYSMLKKYVAIKELPVLEYDEATTRLFPKPVQARDIVILTNKLQLINKLSVAIQSDNRNIIFVTNL